MKHCICLVLVLLVIVHVHTAHVCGKEVTIMPVDIQVVDSLSGGAIENVVVYYVLCTGRPPVFLGIPNPFASTNFYNITEKYYTDANGKVHVPTRIIRLRSWEEIVTENIYVNLDFRYQGKLDQIANPWIEYPINPNGEYKGARLMFRERYEEDLDNPLFVGESIYTEQPRVETLITVIHLERREEPATNPGVE